MEKYGGHHLPQIVKLHSLSSETADILHLLMDTMSTHTIMCVMFLPELFALKIQVMRK